jgi:hypothetical protein
MYRLKTALVLVCCLIAIAGCASSDGSTEVSAVVGPDFAHEGFQPGDSVPGASLRLYRGHTVLLETVLDSSGSTRITPEPGIYDVQVSRDSADPACFWDETVFGISFPSEPLTIEVAFICSGD